MCRNEQSVHPAMWCAQIVGVTIATAFLALAMMTVLTAYEASVEASKLAVAGKMSFQLGLQSAATVRRVRTWALI
jgi:hypothetical protein